MNCRMHLEGVTVLLLLVVVLVRLRAQAFDYPTANLSTQWKNNDIDIRQSVSFADGSRVRSILLRGTSGPRFACGFYCNGNCDGYLFAVFIVQTNSASGIVMPSSGFPQVVWSANRNRLVQQNATLDFTGKGDLVLRDADGRRVWSAGTSGRGVGGLSLTESGNLILLGKNSKRPVVWQSFDHPTDVMVPGQQLTAGHKLVGNTSPTDTAEGPFYLSMLTNALAMFASAAPPQMYFEMLVADQSGRYRSPAFARYDNGSLGIYVLGGSSASADQPDALIPVPEPRSSQFIRVDSDGHLRAYEWRASRWRMISDLLSDELTALSACDYPGVCGHYGICTNGQCSCPKGINASDSFTPINERQPNLGCSPPPASDRKSSCNAAGARLLEVKGVSYFNYVDRNAAVSHSVSEEECRRLCRLFSSTEATFLLGRVICRRRFFLSGITIPSPPTTIPLHSLNCRTSGINAFQFDHLNYTSASARPGRLGVRDTTGTTCIFVM